MAWTFRTRSIALGRAVLVIAFFAILAYVLVLTNVIPENLAEAKDELLSFGPTAPLAAALIQALAVVVFIPGILLIFATAVLFGPDSIWINLVGHTIGASCCFFIARWVGPDAIESILGQRVKTVEKILAEHGFRYLLYMRFLAFVPLPLLTYGPGLVKIRYGDFLVATLLGAAPLIIVMGFFAPALVEVRRVGDLVDPEFALPAVLLVLLQVVPLIAALVVRRRQLRRRNALRRVETTTKREERVRPPA